MKKHRKGEIHIEWDGSHSLESIKQFQESNDYGLYQIYGSHLIYGSNQLLYIGKANDQTFGKRIPQHAKWFYHQDSENIKVYIGRLGGNRTINDEKWGEQIDIAEKLLIHSHKPAYNSSNIQTIPDSIPIETHVFNWCNYCSLMPEVSAFRWLATDEDYFATYKTFTIKG